ncbi:DNA-directed DNA polymerase [Thoreauomyces humboldtii]|nr:DNA-directed DNA polymerase [Thoreauomyces humboldtii]
MHDHRVWVSDIYSYMTTLSKNTHHVTPAAPLNSAPAKVVAKATSVIDQIQTHTSTLDPVVNREQLSQYRAFELLFVHVLLEVYAGDLEAVGVMEELEDCYKLFFSVKKEKEGKKGGKKRKVEDVEEEEDDEELKPIEVLVDILISFLVKSSGLLRSLSQEVFKVFCGQLTKKALDLILDVLSSKSGVAGAQELFEGEDENGDAMEVDAPAGEGDEEEGADEEGSDDSDSDDDEEESEEDEAATAAGEIDEELRLKIKAAMGKAAPETSDDGETSEEEDFMDDDQMGAFDDKLAEIFRQRKEIKTAARDMKQQVLHFKFRVVDLLEVFVTRASKSPLLVELVVPLSKLLETTGRTAEEADLHKRLEALAKNKLFKVKDVPTEEGGLNVERTVEVLEEVHAYARGASEASTVALCSGASLLLVRILSHCKEPTATSTAVATPTTTPKKSKKRKTEDSTTTTTTTIVPSTLSRVAKVYTTSLTDFMAPKTRLKPVLFLDLVARYPVHAWELVPAIVDLQKSAKPYPYIQSVAILERMVKQMPKKDEDLRLEQLRSVWPAFAGNVIDVLVANGGDSEVEEGGSGSNKVLNKERVKELVRDLVVIARRLNKVFGDDEKSKLWKKEPLEKALNVMCDSERFKTIPSLKKHSQSLVALISPSHS